VHATIRAVTTDGGLDTRIAKALSHPLRQRLLMAYSNREVSPSQVARELDESLGDVSYHTKRLVEHGCLELVRAVRGRGGGKHFYTATANYELTDEQFGMLSPSLRRRVAEPVLAQIIEDVTEAGASRALADDDVHISRWRLDLDDEGWAELSRLLEQVAERALEINRNSAGGDRPSSLTILHVRRG
jgi:DNA-binding transcriptional ArsR family regulator